MRAPGLVAVAVAALVLVPAARAASGQVAVGIAPGTSVAEAAATLEAVTGKPVDRTLGPMGALTVTVPDVSVALDSASEDPAFRWVEPVRHTRHLLFVPNDPLAFFQWYLTPIHAFDFWDTPPELPSVRVAVIDSGIDATNPDFAGRIAGGQSFVNSSWKTDELGHGTVVAGEIGAATDNNFGIAGVGLSTQLLIAKVVRKDDSITVADEAAAIKWAVANGAEVINLSLGGPSFDPLEQAAIDYAYANGVVVVAAAGNCDTAGPCTHADYPAALPHVLGVGAVDENGAAASFSDRDPRYVDLAAPGVQILSTFPSSSSLSDPTCHQLGFNSCALSDRREDTGTSFAAPLVSAAAAMVRAEVPKLVASQVLTILEDSAIDIGAQGRDAATGAGLLDVEQALVDATAPDKDLPPADAFETAPHGVTTNDDVAGAPRLYGNKVTIQATFDWYNDPEDVYRVYLRAGQRIQLSLHGPPGTSPTIALWRPATKHVVPINYVSKRAGFLLAYRQAQNPDLTAIAHTTGWYDVNAKAPPRGSGQYRLVITRTG